MSVKNTGRDSKKRRWDCSKSWTWSLFTPQSRGQGQVGILPKNFVNREYKRSTMQSLDRSRSKPNPLATDFGVFEKQNETPVSPTLDVLKNLNPIRLKITNYRKYQRITRKSPKLVRPLPSMRFSHSRTSSSRRHQSKKSLRHKRTKKKSSQHCLHLSTTVHAGWELLFETTWMHQGQLTNKLGPNESITQWRNFHDSL